jgi:MFS family permease
MSAQPAQVSASAFRHRPFTFFWASRLFTSFAVQIMGVAVGWQVYDITRDPFDLGLVGLAQFLPSLLLVLVTGAAADRYSRRMIMTICMLVEGVVALGMLALTLSGQHTVWPIFALLVLLGIARAFFGPASQSLVANLVPTQALANAITWMSSAWHLATIGGPVVGGLLYGLAPEVPYTTALIMLLIAPGLLLMVRLIPQAAKLAEPAGMTKLLAGFRFVWKEPVVLGAISLDLFAVLLGGAVALMPAVARDSLHAGPWGLGMLRAGPGIGALAMAALLAVRPIKDNAGVIMFVCVALFGGFTILFGLSSTPWLSVVALALMGASDMVSVAIRETLLQLWTPDQVRGRVNAVNMVFVGASNELGEFRAGTSAHFFGVVPAILLGGVGTMAVAALWARWFPDLRQARSLEART